MLSTSSFEEFSGSYNEESVNKTLGLTSSSSGQDSVEVTSPLSNVIVAEIEKRKKLPLRSGYEWVYYKVREKFSHFQSHNDLINFAKSACQNIPENT